MFRKKAGAWPVFLVLALLLSLLVLPAQAAEEAIGVTINGTPVTYDDGYGRPFVDAAGRTQVPFRLTMETFGCTVDWDNDTRTAMAEKDGTKVEVPVGRDYLIINGKRADIDTTAQLVDGRVYLPIRPVLEAFDASVTWNSKDHLVVVTTGSSLVRVYFLDVGQGDATLIDCGETEVLIDGGTNSAGKDVVAAIAPYIDGKLDYLIATHPDADHVGGLATLSKKSAAPVYVTRGVSHILTCPVVAFTAGDTLKFAGCTVRSFSTSHDAVDPVGYRVDAADGSLGILTDTGFVTDAMDGPYSYFYACGPLPMLQAIERVAQTPGQYSMEERMGCGFGACMGCTIQTRSGPRRVCKDGPVFDRGEVIL